MQLCCCSSKGDSASQLGATQGMLDPSPPRRADYASTLSAFVSAAGQVEDENAKTSEEDVAAPKKSAGVGKKASVVKSAAAEEESETLVDDVSAGSAATAKGSKKAAPVTKAAK